MSYRVSKHFIIMLLFVISQISVSAEKIDFTGKWQTTWGEVNLVQTGTKVTGSALGYSATVIEGSVTGRRLDFKWTEVKFKQTQTPKQWGSGFYDLSSDGRSFTGGLGRKESNSNIREWDGNLVSKVADVKSNAELKKYSEKAHIESNRVHIGLKNPIKDIKETLGNINKPMKSCYLSDKSIAGFSHDNSQHKEKGKGKLCTEEQRKIISEYMGTFEGSYTGPSNGKVTMSVHDDGVIVGQREQNGVTYPLRGSVSFINRPTENYLQIHVVTSVSAKTYKQQLSFQGKIKKDGILNTNWYGAGKKGSRPGGQIQLRKTAPHKKRVIAKAKAKKAKKKKPYLLPPTRKKPNAPADSTPLFAAAKSGDHNKVMKLIQKGYDVSIVDKNGATPLLVALKHGHLQAAQMLLGSGSDRDHKDNEGKTALHYASIYKVEMMVAMLVMGGADVSVKDNSGKTAKDWAIEKKNAGVIRMFDAMANPKAHPMYRK